MAEEMALNPIELAAELTVAWLENQSNSVEASEVPIFLRSIHDAILSLSGKTAPSEEAIGEEFEVFEPAVSVRKSLASKDHIISMIDGKPYRTLRRHLSTHGLTPETYRERYNLRPDYPMVAESYSAQRREMAKKIGLGNKGRGGRKSKS